MARPLALLALLAPGPGSPRPAQAASLRASPRASPGRDWPADPSGRSSFVTDDGLRCAEGPHRELQAALATYKAKPIGKLYVKAKGERGVTCQSRGYGVDLKGDLCDPNVWIYVKQESDAQTHQRAEDQALLEWRTRWGVDQTTAILMDACGCHPDSESVEYRGNQCIMLDESMGAWVHHSDVDGHELMCDQGPFVYALRALAVMKSTAQLAMHVDDQIAPKTCPQLGFPEVFPKLDHCFPKMNIASRTEISHDVGIQESGEVEGRLFKGGFLEYAKMHSLDAEVLNSVAGCHCLPNSEVGMGMRWNGKCFTEASRSPVRDYWQG
mmetsp:Transcript_10314/g.30258  ORF Transcript_10314/g.30258 Transcript_10314/m.30258 type:complete len:325 (+) Transcript_10314:69-1043(+)